MYCNNCGNLMEDAHRFCNCCGAARPEIIPGPKGSRWVPTLLLVLMAAVGFAVYFLAVGG